MNQRDDIRQILRNLVEEDTGESYPNLTDSMKLREDLGMDSVDLVSVVSQIERHFRIRLSSQDLENISTIGDVLTLLQERVGTGATLSRAG